MVIDGSDVLRAVTAYLDVYPGDAVSLSVPVQLLAEGGGLHVAVRPADACDGGCVVGAGWG
ncbi:MULTISPECIES: hypothetical protein [unclassified Micromonospora]|uniref:hypothetical protein n=1 Tax=unclassified Micromonospora TaxID=2617518 RepID=UPI001C223B90|nr:MULTISPECIES: hypothetical protein [unclassified Micromonospora]MBU8857710.1 hypothetical protein [Micromonospora sp. WMMB482]MDM4783337.1 hypothetical protein [Micromonospora sp. b486]